MISLKFLLPEIRFNKKEETVFAKWNTTKISLPSTISLRHTDSYVCIIIQILGFGIKFDWSINLTKESNNVKKS